MSIFEGFEKKDIIDNASLLNSSILTALKENLHNFKGKYLYEFAIGAIIKATGVSVFFNPSVDVLLQEEESEASPTDETEKAALPSPMHIDMFLLSVSHMNSLMQ